MAPCWKSPSLFYIFLLMLLGEGSGGVGRAFSVRCKGEGFFLEDGSLDSSAIHPFLETFLEAGLLLPFLEDGMLFSYKKTLFDFIY